MITPQQIQNAQTSLGMNQPELPEMEAILERFGYDIVVARWQNSWPHCGEWEQASFEGWLEKHQGEPNMLEQLMVLYPQFGKILTEEILKLKNQVPTETRE